MTTRARLFTLMARKEAVHLAALARAMGQARADLASAEALEMRLHRLMADLAPGPGPVPACMLRNTGLMLDRLGGETAQQQDQARRARAALDSLRGRMLTHEQRRRSGEEAAQAARLAEADLAEARIDAARPAPRAR